MSFFRFSKTRIRMKKIIYIISWWILFTVLIFFAVRKKFPLITHDNTTSKESINLQEFILNQEKIRTTEIQKSEEEFQEQTIQEFTIEEKNSLNQDNIFEEDYPIYWIIEENIWEEELYLKDKPEEDEKFLETESLLLESLATDY